MGKILRIKNLRLVLNGRKILDDINLDFQYGYIHAIVGPNGAGKSTLAYTIMGLEDYRNIEGDIIFDGESIKDLSIDERAKRGITLAWQEPARYEGLKIRKFILASSKKKDVRVVKDVLKKVGLDPEEYMDRALDKTLSGGERKKIELASILAMKPKLVLLDEPDSGIDVASLEKIFDAMRLLKENRTTVILITHSLAVLKQSEYAILLCDGKVLDQGDKEKIMPFFEGKCMPCKHKNIPEVKRDGSN